MKRVAIIGSGGTGKSTLAQQLGTITNLPVYHLDALHWKPGWVPTPEDEWDQLMEELTSQDEWIMDGNYGRSMDTRLQRADTVIFLDYPTRVSMYRAIKRAIRDYGKTRPDMGEGCNERYNAEFFKWVLHYRRYKRPGILKKLDKLKDQKKVYIFESPRQLKEFLEGVKE